MSSSPRKKTFPTLHTTLECTANSSPTTATTAGSSPPSISLQRESDNASPPTVPYTVNDMNTGINHIITEAMVREQLNGGPSPTAKDSITEYESPPKRLFKGLTTTCDGSYGQQLLTAPTSLNIMDSVPVEDVMRWKEFRRKQKTIAAATEIDVDGFPVSDEYYLPIDTTTTTSRDNDGNGEDTSTTSKLGIATSTSNSEVGTEIASNTARYLAKQSNIMARQLMSSSEEGENEEEEDQNDDDDDDETAKTEDWGPPLDVGDDWDTPLNNNNDGNGGKGESSKVEDSDAQNSVEKHVVVDDEGRAAAVAAAVAPPATKEVPTMDEVHNFMNQLKQKSAVGRERVGSIYAKMDGNDNISLSSSCSSSNIISKLSSSTSAAAAPLALNKGNDTKPTTTTTSSAEVHKSLIEHRERMRQQKLEGERKRKEFDARLQLLRSQLHDEAADARLQLLRSKIHGDDDSGGLTVLPTVGGDLVTAHRTIEYDGEKGGSEIISQHKQQPLPVLPGARWSGGLTVWSPSNGIIGSSDAMRSKPPPPTLSSSSPHTDKSNPVQLFPPTGIGVNDDDFSFSPVDVDAVLGKSSVSSNKSVGELFSEAYGNNGRNIGTTMNAVGNDESKASTSSNSYVKKDSMVETYYSKGQPRIAKLALDSLPPDVSPPVSNGSPAVESDKGGGLGAGYVSGFGDKSLASSVNVELGFGTKVDPPLEDEDCVKKEDEKLLGVTVVGSKRRKRKSNSPWTTCETVEEHSKDSLKESEGALEDEGGRHRSALEPSAKDAPLERKQLDPDGIDWKDIPQHEVHSAGTLTPSSSWKNSVGSSLEETHDDQMCPDKVFSQKNDNLPPPIRVPPTPRMTPQARDGQLTPSSQFTPRSKRLPTPRATPRTVRAANLSSNRKFGFGVEDDSPKTLFKMNESPLSRRDNRIDEVPDESSKRKFGGRLEVHTEFPSYKSEMDADEKETEQDEDETNDERSPSIKDIQSKFESKTFGIDHVHKPQQNFREETSVGAPKSQLRTSPVGSPIKGSSTPSRIYLEDNDLRAMSSLETDTYASIEYSLKKGVSDENDATIGDSTLGDGTMDTKKALRYAKRLETFNESEDNSKENHEEEATPSIVALRRKAFESKNANDSVPMSPDHTKGQEDKRSLPNQRSFLSASNRRETDTREEPRHVDKKPSQDYGSFSLSSPGGKTSVVASIKERIAAYDGQNSKNGMPSPYRLSSQSKTFQVRVGGQVKSINIRQGTNDKMSLQKANSISNPSMYTAGADSPSRGLKKDKQYPALPVNHGSAHNSQNGGAYSHQNSPLSNRNQAAGRNVAPIDTAFDYAPDDDDDGITLSPTISEVSGLTLPTLATTLVGGVVPDQDVNQFERTMTPIARLRQKTQGNKFSYDHIDASTPRALETKRPSRSPMETNRPSRRDQIASRIRGTSSNGNLWQRRNVVTEVSHSTSDTSSKSRNASMGYPYAQSASRGKVAEKIANIDGIRRPKNEEESISVSDRVAMMNRQQHKMRQRRSMKDEQSSSLATRDCIRVD